MAKRRDYYSELLELFNNYLNRFPFAYFELARTRRTDWMVWIKEKPDSEPVICEQELTAEAACKKAVVQLQKHLNKLEKTDSEK